MDNHRHAPRRQRDRGAGLVEYGLLVALIALACFLAVTTLGSSTAGKYSDIQISVADAT